MSAKVQHVNFDALPDVLFTEDVAKVLRTSERAVRYAIQQRRIPAHKIGRRHLIPKAALMELLGIAPSSEYSGNGAPASKAV